MANVTSAPIGNPSADSLRDGDGIGHDLGVLEREPLPRAPSAGLDLVEDEQRPRCWVSSRARSRKPGGRSITPASPWIGSSTTAAVWGPTAPSSASIVAGM